MGINNIDLFCMTKAYICSINTLLYIFRYDVDYKVGGSRMEIICPIQIEKRNIYPQVSAAVKWYTDTETNCLRNIISKFR